MKKLFTITIAFLLTMTICNNVFAHSHFVGSNPADGDSLTEPISEITVEFDGRIEQGSYLELTTSTGEAIEIQEIIIEDSLLTSTLAAPLENGEYEVYWNIISADGHPMEGEFTFTVNAEVMEEEETVDEVTEEPSEASENLDGTDEADETEESPAAETNETSSSLPLILIVLLGGIIIVASIFLIKKRK